MELTFNAFCADEIVQAYIDFIKKRNGKGVTITYVSKTEVKETMHGRLALTDKRLKDLPKKIQYTDGRHYLELSQKSETITCTLRLLWEPHDLLYQKVELICDDSLRKSVYNHFKSFEPEKIGKRDTRINNVYKATKQ